MTIVLQYREDDFFGWYNSQVFLPFLKNVSSLEDILIQLRSALTVKPELLVSNRNYQYRIIDRRTGQYLKRPFYLKDLLITDFEIET